MKFRKKNSAEKSERRNEEKENIKCVKNHNEKMSLCVLKYIFVLSLFLLLFPFPSLSFWFSITLHFIQTEEKTSDKFLAKQKESRREQRENEEENSYFARLEY